MKILTELQSKYIELFLFGQEWIHVFQEVAMELEYLDRTRVHISGYENSEWDYIDIDENSIVGDYLDHPMLESIVGEMEGWFNEKCNEYFNGIKKLPINLPKLKLLFYWL